MKQSVHRLFVALRLPAGIRSMLIDAMGGIPGARWQDDEQLHLTLRYIGEIATPIAEDVATALSALRAAPLTLAIAGTGRFLDTRRGGGAVWAGVRPMDAVTRLHHKVDRALVRAGLPPETRAYLPHVTLARLSRGAGPSDRFLADRAALSTPPFTIAHMTLFESRLSPEGATYTAIARYPLVA